MVVEEFKHRSRKGLRDVGAVAPARDRPELGGSAGFAAYTILDAAAGVDWGDVLSTVGDASWKWIAFAFVVVRCKPR
jgi:uncharacterized membrane protein YbhN (UPF0104 family)